MELKEVQGTSIEASCLIILLLISSIQCIVKRQTNWTIQTNLCANSVTSLSQFIRGKGGGAFICWKDKHVRLDGDDKSVSILSLWCAVRFLVCILTFGWRILVDVFFFGLESHPYFDSCHILFPRQNALKKHNNLKLTAEQVQTPAFNNVPFDLNLIFILFTTWSLQLGLSTTVISQISMSPMFHWLL